MKPIRQLHHSRQKTVTNSQLWSYAFLFIVLVVFMATVGLKLLINSALFISGAINKDRKDDRTETGQLLEDPRLDSLPVATNSAMIELSGTVPKPGSLTFYINDNDQKTLLVTQDSFSTTVHLDPGDNTVFVELEDSETGKKYTSDKQQVSYVSEQPNLEVTAPADGTKTTKDSIDIQGKTDPGNSIRINGRPGVVSSDGSFTIPYLLKDGENTITIEVTNQARTSSSAQVRVTKEGL